MTNDSLPLPAIILMNPSRDQNIGSIARVMMNFGFTRLIIVTQNSEDHEFAQNADIQRLARKAISLVEQAQVVRSLQHALTLLQFPYLIGTISSGRVSTIHNLQRIPVLLDKIPEMVYSTVNLAIAFGTEAYGLTNEEIAACNLLVTIPTSPNYPAMNLSHAVAIVCYHFYNLFVVNGLDPQTIINHQPISQEKMIHLLTSIERVTQHDTSSEGYSVRQCLENVAKRAILVDREADVLKQFFDAVYFTNKRLSELENKD